MLRLLCVWGALAVGGSAAPALIQNWIPCLSTIQGYGLCEESLFVVGQTIPQQPVYHPIYQPPQYPISPDHSNPGDIDQIVVILSPNESSSHHTPYQPPTNSTEINELFERLFKILEDVRKSNREQEEEKRAREPTFDYDQIDQALEKVNQVTKKATKLVFGTAYLHQKLDGAENKNVPDYDQLDKIFGNIEQAAKNISDIIATLKNAKGEVSKADGKCSGPDCKADEKCSGPDCKAEEKCSGPDCKADEKCSGPDCKADEKCSGPDCQADEKCSGPDCKADEKCSGPDCKADEKCSGPDCKADHIEDPTSAKNTTSNEGIEERESSPNGTSLVSNDRKSPTGSFKNDVQNATESVSNEIDKISENIDNADSKMGDAFEELGENEKKEEEKPEEKEGAEAEEKEGTEAEQKKVPKAEEKDKNKAETKDDSPIDPEDIPAYVESVIKKLDELAPATEPTPTEVDPKRLKKDISELGNKALIHRFIEAVHDLAHLEVESLEKVIPKELTDTDRENAFNSLVKSKYSNDEAKSSEVTELDEQLADFATKVNEFIEKGVLLEDLSKTIDALDDDKTPEADLTEKYKDITKEDVDALKETMTNLMASGVPLQKIDDLAAKLDDFDKEKKSAIQDAKTIDESTLDNILGEKLLREELSDFGKIVSSLYEKGISQEQIDDLNKKVIALKENSIADILGALESKKEKREVTDETNVYAEIYDLIAEVIHSNSDDASIDAYIKKVDELTSAGLRIEAIFETTVQIVTEVVEKEERLTRKVKRDLIGVHKNELFDVIRDAYNDDFSESTVDEFFNKVDDMMVRGVEPFHILKNTLGNIFLLVLNESQSTPAVRKVENNELYHLIEEAVMNNVSDTSMMAFNNKIQQLVTDGVDPIQLGVDVIGDLFMLVLRGTRPKREDGSYYLLYSELMQLKTRMENYIRPFLETPDFLEDKYPKQHITLLQQELAVLEKWSQYTANQLGALNYSESSTVFADEPITSYEELLKEIVKHNGRLEEYFQPFLTAQNFLADEHRGQHLTFLKEAKSIYGKWMKYAYDHLQDLGIIR